MFATNKKITIGPADTTTARAISWKKVSINKNKTTDFLRLKSYINIIEILLPIARQKLEAKIEQESWEGHQ